MKTDISLPYLENLGFEATPNQFNPVYTDHTEANLNIFILSESRPTTCFQTI